MSSQAAWALITGGVAKARVEAHRLHHLVDRATAIAEASPHKEKIYQYAGDVLLGIPTRLEHLESVLDKTSFALSKMGEDFLKSRITKMDKQEVEEAVNTTDMATRVASVWLRAEQQRAVITNAHKSQYAQIAKRLGLDGNGRFRSIGEAINRVWDALSDLGDFQIDDVPSSHLFQGDQGHRALHISRKTDDPFTNIEITNSMVVISWTELRPGIFEVVSYLS